MEKNTAGKWIVFAYGLPDHATPGLAITGDAANITANIRIDGGAANAVDDTNPTELEDGYYIFDITAVETNGKNLLLAPASSTSNVQVIAVPGAVWTRPANFNDLSVEVTTGRIDLLAASQASLDAIEADTSELQADDVPGLIATLDAVVDTVKAETALIVADTNELQGDDVPGLIATLDAVVDTVKAETAIIVADTNELQGDDVPGLIATLDAVVDTVKAETALIVEDTGTTLPALIGNIGSGSSGAINFEAEDDNVLGAIKGITFVGVQTSGTYDSIAADEGTYQNITHSGDAIDLVTQYDVGGNRQAVEIAFNGYLSGGNDVITLQAYDYVGTAWDTIFSLVGQPGTVDVTETIKLLSKHTGTTGADKGKVLIRSVCTAQSSPDYFVDQMLIAAVNVSQTAGYANGAIWANSNASNTSTEPFVDGVADNPVSTMGAVNTLVASLGLNKIEISPGSSFTFAASQDNHSFKGDRWILALGGQSISSSHIAGADVSGVCSGAIAPEFHQCHVGNITVPPSRFHHSDVEGVVTLSAGITDLHQCSAELTAALDFGAAVGNTTVLWTDFSGDLIISNLGALGTDVLYIRGHGKLTLDASCVGGTINWDGHLTITDNGSGITVNKDEISDNVDVALTEVGKIPKSDGSVSWNATALGAINAEADTALSDYDGPTDTEMVAAFTEIKGATFAGATDSLEAIRDRGDTAWVTGSGLTLQQTRDAMKLAPTAGAPAAGSVDEALDNIEADTNELQADDVPGLISTLDAVVDTVKAETAIIVADTNELQTDDVPGLIAALVVPDAAGVAPTAVEIRAEIDSNSTQLAAIVEDTASMGYIQNEALPDFEFPMVLATDGRTAAPGLTVTGTRSINGGAFVAIAGSIAEVSNGIYAADLLAADTNGKTITYLFSAATADTTKVTIRTRA